MQVNLLIGLRSMRCDAGLHQRSSVVSNGPSPMAFETALANFANSGIAMPDFWGDGQESLGNASELDFERPNLHVPSIADVSTAKAQQSESSKLLWEWRIEGEPPRQAGVGVSTSAEGSAATINCKQMHAMNRMMISQHAASVCDTGCHSAYRDTDCMGLAFDWACGQKERA